MPKLTPKQQRFVDEYLIDGNATQAAIRAGYSAKTARAIGAENLTKPDIAALVKSARETATAKALEKFEVTKERVIGELARLGFSNMQDFASVDAKGTPFLDLSKLNRDQWAAVQQIKVDDDGAVTLKLYDKRATLIDLGKAAGLFTEKVDHQITLDTNTDSARLEQARRIAFLLASASLAGEATGANAPTPT
jgi:phage terminase small subunit